MLGNYEDAISSCFWVFAGYTINRYSTLLSTRISWQRNSKGFSQEHLRCLGSCLGCSPRGSQTCADGSADGGVDSNGWGMGSDHNCADGGVDGNGWGKGQAKNTRSARFFV